MRLATSTLTLLLCFGLPGASLLHAQEVTVDMPQGQEVPDNPDGAQPPAGGDDATGHPPGSQPAGDVHGISTHGLIVQVLQDPIRIAPGEQGHLVLLMRLPKGKTVEKGGQLMMQHKQGPLNLGNPIWDPPAKGKNHYDDVLVIKVPLSLDGKAKYGKHPFQGSLRLRGDFFTMGEQSAEVSADGGMPDPAAPRQASPQVPDPGRAEVPFQYAVHVGPPMPKASKGQGKAAASNPRVGSGSTVDPDQGSAKAVGSAGPADVVPIPGAGPAHRVTRESGNPSSGALPEDAPQLAEEDQGGIPWWMLSLALVVLAALSFVVQARKS